MKIFIFLFLILFSTASVFAQVNYKNLPIHKAGNEPKKKSFVLIKQATVDYNELGVDYSPNLLLNELPKQGAKKIEPYYYPENYKKNQVKKKGLSLPLLTKGLSFQANPWGLGTPNDNDMAISDSGIVISVINKNIYIKNITTNSLSPIKSLALFTTPTNSLHQEFDPKVIYDPLKDRFVLACMVGFVDSTSKIIVGFSQTNNPAGAWNLYTLPGDPLNLGLWSDYPMLSMTEKELFLSVNYLYNDSTWQAGFVETLVWQMKKDSGYVGLPIGATLHHNIKYNNKPIRNLCPVKGGSHLYKPNMYFVSNRNLASQNDSVFLINITDTIGSATSSLTTKLMVSSQFYYFPPSGRQINTTNILATNDARNLGAFYENNKIQYVHNTMNPTNSLCTIYYGVINNPASISPTLTGYLIENDSMDFAYPNISYAGNSASDNNAIISFNHTSNKVYAGTSAIRSDAQGNYSPILRIQNGTKIINLLTGNLERWGDYSGSQRRYNKPGEVWMSGYYSYWYSSGYPNAHAAWVAQIDIGETLTAIYQEKEEVTEANVYPNPSKDIFSVDLNLAKSEYLTFELFDAQGKLVALLLRDWVKIKQNVFSFVTYDLKKGFYILKISGNFNTNITKKVIVN